MDAHSSTPGASPEVSGGEESAGPSSLRRIARRAGDLLGLVRESESGADPSTLFSAVTGQDERSEDVRRLLANVMRLRETRVDKVMTPRADIVAVDLAASLDETLEVFRESQHSRLPVYRDSLDDPVGVVHLKDLALSHGFGARPNDFSLSSHLKSVLIVPPSMRIQALLQRMQATRRHMALVIDEYGGVDGLATIEDVIEQIVGEIEDEHDDAERPLWRREPSGSYLAEARAEIEDFAAATGSTLISDDIDEEVDTLGGLVFMLGDRVPERGEVLTHPLGHEFEIVDADPRKIKRLRVRLARPDSADEASGAER